MRDKTKQKPSEETAAETEKLMKPAEPTDYDMAIARAILRNRDTLDKETAEMADDILKSQYAPNIAKGTGTPPLP